VTSSTAVRVPVREDRHVALRRLICVSAESFADEYWSRRPLLARADELQGGFDDLFTSAAVDELLSTRGLRTPFLRMAKDGATIAERTFTSGGGAGAGIPDQASDEAVLRHFTDGATLVLQGLHRLWAPIITFSQQLAADLGHPVQVNAYVTPPQSTGFSDHYDVHDVFVLQVAGDKHWRIREPVRAQPLRSDPWTAHRDAVEDAAARTEPVIDQTLRPGDCLYLPRGYLHSATALGGTSIHLTIGVHPWTRRHLADQLVKVALDRVSESPEIRAALPLGTDLTGSGAAAADVELVRAALLDSLREVDSSDLHASLAAAARSAQRAAPLRPLVQADTSRALRPEAVLAVRDHVAAALDTADTGSVLHSRAGSLGISPEERPRVEALLAAGAAAVDALGVELARRLLVAGVVVPA
jgi:ribosomal protein L16 Arg81 hydroxylase